MIRLLALFTWSAATGAALACVMGPSPWTIPALIANGVVWGAAWVYLWPHRAKL